MSTKKTSEAISVSTWTPPRWVNATMKVLLRTPGIERFLGRALALITVTGRKSGRTYTTPVSYTRDGGTIVVLTKRFRVWWRNLEEKPDVELRIGGRTFRGTARASVGDERELPTLVKFLEGRRADARAYGLTLSPEGRVDPDEARALLSQIVVIRIELNAIGSTMAA